MAGWLGAQCWVCSQHARACSWLHWLCAAVLAAGCVAAALACVLSVSGRPCAARSKRGREKKKAHLKTSLLDVVVSISLTLVKLMLCNLQKQHAKVRLYSRAHVARFERVLARDRRRFAVVGSATGSKIPKRNVEKNVVALLQLLSIAASKRT